MRTWVHKHCLQVDNSHVKHSPVGAAVVGVTVVGVIVVGVTVTVAAQSTSQLELIKM